MLGEVHQFFLQQPPKLLQRFFYAPEEAGLGLDVDEGKVESEKAITFS